MGFFLLDWVSGWRSRSSRSHAEDPEETGALLQESIYQTLSNQPPTDQVDAAQQNNVPHRPGVGPDQSVSSGRSGKKMKVQLATPIQHASLESSGAKEWKNIPMTSGTPKMLNMANWSLKPLERPSGCSPQDFLHAGLRILLVSVPITLSFPDLIIRSIGATLRRGRDTNLDKYMKYESPCPGARQHTRIQDTRDDNHRLMYPQKLLVKTESGWDIKDTSTSQGAPFLFISHVGSKHDDKLKMRDTAQRIAEEHNYNRIYLDDCCFKKIENDASQSPALDHDIYTICDVVRSASKVAVLLESSNATDGRRWGDRMWTFMEGLLAPGQDLLVYNPDTQTIVNQTKTQLAASHWVLPGDGMALPDRFDSAREMAEYVSGTTIQDPITIVGSLFDALSKRNKGVQNSPDDMAFAAMAFFQHRLQRQWVATTGSSQLQPVKSSLFHTLVDLATKTDFHIIERMLCLATRERPYDHDRPRSDCTIWTTLAERDELGFMYHEIENLCSVEGRGEEDETVIVNTCRAIPIRWESFTMPVRRKSLTAPEHRAIAPLSVLGLNLFFPLGAAVWLIPLLVGSSMGAGPGIEAVIRVAVGFFVAWLTTAVVVPFALRKGMRGLFAVCSPEIIGFEGIMPIDRLEELVFGAKCDLLAYEPSALARLDREISQTRSMPRSEPRWIEHPGRYTDDVDLKKGQRLFTLVLMGKGTVVVFAAKRPPTVALLCGKETTGLVRAVLCSWDSTNNCHYKEAVVQMEAGIEKIAEVSGRIKVCFLNPEEWKEEQAAKIADETRRGQERLKKEAERAARRLARTRDSGNVSLGGQL